MLGSLVVAQMETVACEGLGGPIRHGAGCASALQSAVAPNACGEYAMRCDTEIMNK